MHSPAFTCIHVHFRDFTFTQLRSFLLISLQLRLQFGKQSARRAAAGVLARETTGRPLTRAGVGRVDRGVEGERSGEVSATTADSPDVVPPAAPTGLRLVES